MKIKCFDIKELREWEKEVGLEVIVNEVSQANRNNPQAPVEYNFNANIPDTIIKLGTGSDIRAEGDTADEAIEAFCNNISGKIIIYKAQDENERREIAVPKLYFDPDFIEDTGGNDGNNK